MGGDFLLLSSFMDQYSLYDSDLNIRLRGAWEQVQRRLQSDMSAAWFDRFIRPLRPHQLEDGVVTLAIPGRFIYEWVKERYFDNLKELFSDELGEEVHLKLVIEAREREPISALNDIAVSMPIQEESRFRPSERFSFETFVVGQSNRLAFAGAKSVADEPGTKYNPLFIYGPSGLGKTHLLHSIAREILSRDPRFPLVYMSAQQFAEQFVNALQNNRIEQFRRAQRNVGMWLLDDIQFVAGRDKTQEEIFHTFNYLHDLGKQIVITSDRPPRDLFLLEERLRSRFEAGLVADIQPPDTETRCAIILSKAIQEQVHISHDVAMVLAEGVPGNIRILEGALTKLMVQAGIEGVPVSVDYAAQMVEQHYRSRAHAKPSFTQIVDLVSKTFNIPTDEIKGTSRKAPIVHARHVAVFVTREITGDSWKHIGHLFGDRDHTSMMHGYQKISEMMIRDRELRAVVKMLIKNLNPD
jgi:chromosomal replication initiator protein